MKRLLGLDVGSRTIGIAVSDPLGLTAQGHSVLRRTNLNDDLKRLSEIIAEYSVETVVIGLPKNMNNSIGFQAEQTLEFVEVLKNTSTCQVVLWDERLTTKAAQMHLRESGMTRKKRSQLVDMVAAIYILEGYLNSR